MLAMAVATPKMAKHTPRKRWVLSAAMLYRRMPGKMDVITTTMMPTNPSATPMPGHTSAMVIVPPTNSTVFASVTGDGLLEVWDVSANTLDPLKSISTGKPRSCVAFAKNSPILVTGDNDGTVDVYQLLGSLAESVQRTAAQQAAAIDKVTSTVQHSS